MSYKKPLKKFILLNNIIRKRGKKSLEKWLGYPDSFNSWIDNER